MPKKKFEEIITENFPNMRKERVNQIQEVQGFPSRINPRRNTSRHIVIKVTKIKDKDVKSNKGKKTTYKGNPIRFSADFSTDTLQARR